MKKYKYLLSTVMALSTISGDLFATDPETEGEPAAKKICLRQADSAIDSLLEQGVSAQKILNLGEGILKNMNPHEVSQVPIQYLAVWNTLSDDAKLKILLKTFSGEDNAAKIFYGTLGNLSFTLDLDNYVETQAVPDLNNIGHCVSALILKPETYQKLLGQPLIELFPKLSKLKVIEFTGSDETPEFLGALYYIKNNQPQLTLELHAHPETQTGLSNLMDSELKENVVDLELTDSILDEPLVETLLFPNLTHFTLELINRDDVENTTSATTIRFMETVLNNCKNIQQLTISGYSETTQDVYNLMKVVSQKTDLQGLDLVNFLFLEDEDPKVKEIMEELSKLKNLTRLNLSETQLGYVNQEDTPENFLYLAKALRSLKQLSFLGLGNTQIDKADEDGMKALGNSLKALQNLEEIDLEESYILDNADWKLFMEALPHLPRLTTLNLDGFKFETEDPESEEDEHDLVGEAQDFLEIISKCRNLTSLSLNNGLVPIFLDNQEALDFLKSLPKLTYLDLSGLFSCSFTQEDLEKLMGLLGQMKRLKSLGIMIAPETPSPQFYATLLEGLSKIQSLEFLCLTGLDHPQLDKELFEKQLPAFIEWHKLED